MRKLEYKGSAIKIGRRDFPEGGVISSEWSGMAAFDFVGDGFRIACAGSRVSGGNICSNVRALAPRAA